MGICSQAAGGGVERVLEVEERRARREKKETPTRVHPIILPQC